MLLFSTDIYKKDGWYYLIIAEGGTHRWHMITMARSRTITGPFKGYKNNPLITGVPGSPITCVGHADLVQDTTGNWWAFLLARRELGEREDSYPLGRETYMVPVDWPEGEFPTFELVQLQHSLPSTRRIVAAKQRMPGLELQVQLSSPRVIYIRDPILSNYLSEGTAVVLRSSDAELGSMCGSPTFVGERQTSLECIVNAQIDLSLAAKEGHAGLAVYKDPFRYASVDVDLKASRVSFNLRHLTQEHIILNPRPLREAAAARLKIRSSVDSYTFLYSAFVSGKWSPEFELATTPCNDMSGDDFTGEIFPTYPQLYSNIT